MKPGTVFQGMGVLTAAFLKDGVIAVEKKLFLDHAEVFPGNLWGNLKGFLMGYVIGLAWEGRGEEILLGDHENRGEFRVFAV